jgi:hypothetical protein
MQGVNFQMLPGGQNSAAVDRSRLSGFLRPGTYAGSCGGIGMVDFAMGVFVCLAACAPRSMSTRSSDSYDGNSRWPRDN